MSYNSFMPCPVNFSVVLTIVFLLSACSSPVPEFPQSEKHKSVVLIVVDQMGSEPLTRYAATLNTATSGFIELTRRGVYFPIARYPYLHPETCPGHATIATGTYPWKHGIVSNNWFDKVQGKDVYCIGNGADEVATKYLLRPTLADILKDRGSDTYEVSVSGKDRAAIMLAGRSGDQVLWFDKSNGEFRTSTSYPKLSSAVKEYNREANWNRYFHSSWKVSDAIDIPYGFGTKPDAEFFSSLYQSPAVDEMSTELFLRLIVEVNQQHPSSQNIYALSLSALDVVGHRYDSQSPHYMDVLNRVDKLIGSIIMKLDLELGRDGYVLVVTADHGSFPIQKAGMGSVAAQSVVCARSGSPHCEGVAANFCYSSLEEHSPFYTYAQHSHFEGRGDDCEIIYTENQYPFLGPGTSHLTPYPVDTDVPLWIFGGEEGVLRQEIVSPASILPTVLSLIGQAAPDYLDGVDLKVTAAN